jgi:hypothetical protein
MLLALLLASPVAAQTKKGDMPREVKAAILAKCEKQYPNSYLSQGQCVALEKVGWLQLQEIKK